MVRDRVLNRAYNCVRASGQGSGLWLMSSLTVTDCHNSVLDLYSIRPKLDLAQVRGLSVSHGAACVPLFADHTLARHHSPNQDPQPIHDEAILTYQKMTFSTSLRRLTWLF